MKKLFMILLFCGMGLIIGCSSGGAEDLPNPDSAVEGSTDTDSSEDSQEDVDTSSDKSDDSSDADVSETLNQILENLEDIENILNS